MTYNVGPYSAPSATAALLESIGWARRGPGRTKQQDIGEAAGLGGSTLRKLTKDVEPDDGTYRESVIAKLVRNLPVTEAQVREAMRQDAETAAELRAQRERDRNPYEAARQAGIDAARREATGGPAPDFSRPIFPGRPGGADQRAHRAVINGREVFADGATPTAALAYDEERARLEAEAEAAAEAAARAAQQAPSVAGDELAERRAASDPKAEILRLLPHLDAADRDEVLEALDTLDTLDAAAARFAAATHPAPAQGETP